MEKVLPEKRKRRFAFLLFTYDLLSFAATAALALLLCDGTGAFLSIEWPLPVALAALATGYLYMMYRSNLYTTLWRYAGVSEFLRLLTVIVFEFLTGAVLWLTGFFPHIRFVCIATILLLDAAILPRYAIRVFLSARRMNRSAAAKDAKRLLIVGAGSAGATILREVQTSDHLHLNPVCFADDDPNKRGTYIYDVPVAGTTDEIPEIVKRYGVEQIVIAISAAPRKEISRIAKICASTHCETRVLPGVYQLVDGTASISKVRHVEIADLLGREQIKVDLDEIMGYIRDRVVLVTGGGGSIGSELCRQIAGRNPKQLIIFDIYENNAYDIQQELIRQYGDKLNLTVLIGSVRDFGKLESLFETYHPEIVFNAAAHKHVPLMETSPNEAVKNNVFGTLNMARCADRYGVLRFVQISTDKAVNPTNVMGATKRICEMIIQVMAKHSKTEFAAVRFGNVLGSNGSVIPLFKKQIKEGGPVTVTHPDIVRYFMTIPEAVSLVLQAGAYAKGGEIFVLDMGEQVRIYDLALNLIRLSGLEPNVDIDVVFTGLRPGEKLYEERLMDEEGMKKTANDMISIGKPLEIDEENLFAKLDELYEEAYRETDRMKDLVHELVPTYRIDRGHETPVQEKENEDGKETA